MTILGISISVGNIITVRVSKIFLRLEDDSGFVLLEDGSRLLLEGQRLLIPS